MHMEQKQFPDPKPESPKAQTVYINGFQLGLSTADAFVVLQRNGQNFLTVNMSYTTAKSLAEKLSEMISDLEKHCKRPIMSSEDVARFLGLVDKGDKTIGRKE